MSELLPGLMLESDNTSETTLYRQLFTQLQQLILQGRLPAGHRLPSSRALAAQLSISRNTVKTAYEMLTAEGYLQSQVGAGSFVTSLAPELLGAEFLKTQAEHTQGESGAAPLPVSGYAEQFQTLRPLNSDQRLRMQPAIPALDQFPLNQWKRCLAMAASRIGLDSTPPQGNAQLREQITHFLFQQRGMEVSSEQILITSGSQQGSYMIAKLLTDPDDRVLLETPGFPGTAGAFATIGCKITPVALNDEIASLPEAKLICVTPSRNFPLGHTLGLPQRLALLQWAQQNRCWILEDDYDSEFSAGRAISSLFAMSASEQVIYTGTFSRTMFPGLRLGYIVLPPALVSLFAQARRYMDGGLSQVAQTAMAEFMAQGFFSQHLKKMRQHYQQRRECLIGLIQQSALAQYSCELMPGGMHLVLHLPDYYSDRALTRELIAQGYGIRALSGYDLKTSTDNQTPALNGLVIGYCAETDAELKAGVQAIERCLG